MTRYVGAIRCVFVRIVSEQLWLNRRGKSIIFQLYNYIRCELPRGNSKGNDI